jgi:Family of unknown function (DUF6365)
MNQNPPISGSRPSCGDIRAIFLLSPSRAYGEINVAVPLAKSIADQGAQVWFIASPLAARIATLQFPGRVFVMGESREANQVIFWRVVKKYRVNVVVFSELYEVLQPRRMPDCPLLDRQFFQDIEYLDATLVFLDFIAHVPVLQQVAGCTHCAQRFGGGTLATFLQRLWVILPCPLNEPGEVRDRRGVPYRVHELPVPLSSADRTSTRKRLLGANGRSQGILIVRTGSTWQAKLAKEYGVRVYDHLTELLADYLRGLKRPVTVVSVSDKQRLRPDRARRMRVVNVGNLDPTDYQRLILSADLVLTDNQIGYTLATTIGSVAAGVMVNSFQAEDIVQREGPRAPVSRIVQRIERECPGSIYPHRIFPLPADDEVMDEESQADSDSAPFGPDVIRLGRMRSSPYVKIEMYGGRRTREQFEWLLEDPAGGQYLRQQDRNYIGRLNAIDDGATVLAKVFQTRQLTAHTAW